MWSPGLCCDACLAQVLQLPGPSAEEIAHRHKCLSGSHKVLSSILSSEKPQHHQLPLLWIHADLAVAWAGVRLFALAYCASLYTLPSCLQNTVPQHPWLKGTDASFGSRLPGIHCMVSRLREGQAGLEDLQSAAEEGARRQMGLPQPYHGTP